jgi:hypothetical protein
MLPTYNFHEKSNPVYAYRNTKWEKIACIKDYNVHSVLIQIE